ncbi:hypothetical protein Ppa06_58210 [Planomonospora parontospora subsp. parontospora]|uniref:Uncharacterized protein n=3 Tax=Planomonospora TaxID=1998 RepID=A0AA37BLY5_9ACTN|nr:hypothetical protein [Planomonospora parontospora]GGK90263.1 hypothetical protein GCM10010126_57100 [Planomonospora parontospora]GII12023.1 hypothetical protein Ppa06_58210 [Planomonospora parontospora subsp. parontospora]
MARTDLTAVAMTRAGVNLGAALTPANADGHAYIDNGRRMVRLKNTDSTAKTVTVQIPATVDGQDVEDREYIVPATTGDVLLPPFPAVYRRPDGKVFLDYSAITGLSVAVYELPV